MTVLLFDLDGVLVDSAHAYYDAWSTWATFRGVDLDAIRQVAFGRRPVDIIRHVVPGCNATHEAELLDRLLQATTEPVRAADAAAELLARLTDGRWGIVTSSAHGQAHRMLLESGLPIPSMIVCAEDVVRGKPHPDCYRLAARRLDVTPSQCVAVEDAPDGIRAARAAGMATIALCTTHSRHELALADTVVEGLADAVPLLVDPAHRAEDHPGSDVFLPWPHPSPPS
jgi:sugar-phosphatase